MIDIYLCEDDSQQLDFWKRQIQKYISFNLPEMRIVCATTSPHGILSQLEVMEHTGIYFLDIDLQADIDGLQLAQKIRKADPRGYIVFITTHDEMAAMTFAYKVEAMDFIVKDEPENLPERIIECLDAALENHAQSQKQNKNSLVIKTEGMVIYLDQSDILYIESSDTVHKVVVHTHTGIKSFYSSLKELQSSLDPESFYRCDKSIIVNLDHVKQIHNKESRLILDSGESCKAARRKLLDIQKALSRRREQKNIS